MISEEKIGTKFVDQKDMEWTYIGEEVGEMDVYHKLRRKDGAIELLSVIGAVEDYGYRRVEDV